MPNSYTQSIEQAIQGREKFREFVQTVNASGFVQVQKGCYAWFAVNMGDTNARVNQMPLLPSLAPGTLYGGRVSYFDNFRFYAPEQFNVLIDTGGTVNQVVITQMCIV